MACIRFQASSDSVDIHGTERRHLSARILDSLFVASIGFEYMTDECRRDVLSRYFPSWVTEIKQAKLWLNTCGNSRVDGQDVFSLILNTGVSMGSDAVKLAARIHGQCEVHGYVEPVDFLWLSEIIGVGLREGIFTPDSGWDELRGMAEKGKDDDSPIVMSYSVTDYFPNPGISNFEGDCDDWDELDDPKRWELGVAGLRSVKSLRICPESFSTWRCGDGMNGLQLSAKWRSEVAQ